MIKPKIKLSAEDSILAHCGQIEPLKDLLHDDLDWPRILQKSVTEGVSCLLYRDLLKYKNTSPPDILDKLKVIYYANMARNAKICRETGAVLSSFNRANLKAIPLKGVFLAEKVYDNIAMRAMADVDLLVKKEDLPEAGDLLSGMGYKMAVRKELFARAIKRPYLNSVDYFKEGAGSPALHIHWHIVNVSLPTYLYTKNIRMDRFWESARPATLAGAPAFELAPHHLIIYLAEHALKHSYDKLILLSDISAAVKKYADEINWDTLIAEAKALGMERQAFYSLYFARYFSGAGIPDGALSRISPERAGIMEDRFFRAVLDDRRGTKLCYFVYLGIIKGKMDKFRFISGTLFPPRDALALFFNIDKPKTTIMDYLLFLTKRFSHLKNIS